MFSKNLRNSLTSICLAVFCMTSCVVVEKRTTVVQSKSVKSKPMPPGQAKKMHGSQSAKPFAPGQQKKKR